MPHSNPARRQRGRRYIGTHWSYNVIAMPWPSSAVVWRLAQRWPCHSTGHRLYCRTYPFSTESVWLQARGAGEEGMPYAARRNNWLARRWSSQGHWAWRSPMSARPNSQVIERVAANSLYPRSCCAEAAELLWPA